MLMKIVRKGVRTTGASGRRYSCRARLPWTCLVAAMIGFSHQGHAIHRVTMSIGIDELLHACGIDCRFAKDGIYGLGQQQSYPYDGAPPPETPPLPLQIAR